MANNIQVKQINMHHSKGATSLMSKTLTDKQTKKQELIVLAQEPWVNKNVIQGFDTRQVNFFYAKSTGTKPRTCIITTKEIQAMQLHKYCNGDITTVLVQLKKGTVNEEAIFCSVYMPHEETEQVLENLVREVIDYASDSGIPIMIGADSNSHHTVWGSTNIN